MKVFNPLRSAAALSGIAMLVACGTAYAGTSVAAAATSVASSVEVQQIRNATVKIDFAGTTFLVDPMLSAKGAFPGFPGTYRSELRNPLVDLPFSADEVLKSVEAVVVTHTHTDHWDEAAQKQIPKNMPVFVQNDADAKMRCPSNFVFQRVALMPPGIAEQHAC